MMKRYIGLLCGAVLLVALAAGCSGAFGFDGKDVPDGTLGAGNGGGTGMEGDGSGGGGSTVDVANPFKGTVWRALNSNFTLTFAESTVSYSGAEYNYAPKRNDDGSYEATLTFKADAAVPSKKYGSLNLNSANAPFGRLVVGKTGSTCFLKDEGTDSGATDGFEITDGKLVKYTGSRASVTVPGSVTYIGDGAFKDCATLESVRISRTVESIGKDAFGGCAALRTVLYDGNETQWKNMLFYYDQQGNAVGDATGLRGRTVYSATTNNVSWAFDDAPSSWRGSVTPHLVGMAIERYPGEGGSVKFPVGTAIIGEKVFYKDTKITDIVIPSTVTSIGKEAFTSVKALKTVTIPGSASIGEKAFSGCTGIESVSILGNGVTSIEKSAFSECTGLTSVTISNGVASIGEEAFAGCTTLESVTLPAVMTGIGGYAFKRCASLASVTISEGAAVPEGVTLPEGEKSIGDSAFSGCSIVSVVIPGGVTNIGEKAFSRCTSLTDVTISNDVASIGKAAFSECGLTSIIIPSSVMSIGSSAFEKCNGLTSVTLSNAVASIGDYAFRRCDNLRTVMVSEGTPVPEGVTLPEDERSIGRDVFQCKNLTDVTIPGSVTSIGGAFFECPNLTSVRIPSSVKNIGGYAFYYCFALTTVNYDGTKTQWDEISIDKNSCLDNMTIIGKDAEGNETTWPAVGTVE